MKRYKVTRVSLVEATGPRGAWSLVSGDLLDEHLTLVSVQEIPDRETPQQANGWGAALKHQLVGGEG